MPLKPNFEFKVKSRKIIYRPFLIWKKALLILGFLARDDRQRPTQALNNECIGISLI